MKKMLDHENPRSIKYYIKRYIEANKDIFNNKVVIDIPAGKGFTSNLLDSVGAKVLPYDLFPENFNSNDKLKCKHADLSGSLPMKNGSADFIFCQEGIEHIANPMLVFEEFNRILKPGGKIFLTTPNYSNLRSRMSYFINESERFRTMMPPNEIDSIWGVSSDKKKIYYGHIFLLGIQRLRILATLSGFTIAKVIPNKVKTTSLFLLPLTYPLIVFFNYKTYLRAVRKNKSAEAKKVYKQVLDLNLNIRVLLDGYLFLEIEKKQSVDEYIEDLEYKKHKLQS